jgi:tetratricopeptide (TPR) repeat protein
MKTLLRLSFFYLLLFSVASPAQEAAINLSEKELLTLPRYCYVRIRALNGPEYKEWERKMGPDLIHTHHYCGGLSYLKRYYGATTERERKFFLRSAQANLEYMVNHASPGYSLMPDVYFRLGEVHRLAGRAGNAKASYDKSIELNPRLASAYGGLADMHVQLGQQAKALKVVSDGLRYNPETRSLQRRYRELGGKPPYPEPADAPLAAPGSTAQDNETAPENRSKQETENPVASDAKLSSPASAETTEPRIGSPTNPNCRFCAD